jgi:hypothetical protein
MTRSTPFECLMQCSSAVSPCHSVNSRHHCTYTLYSHVRHAVLVVDEEH